MNKKSYICRVCLDSQDVSVSLSSKYQDFVLYEFINNITNLNIRLTDGFPDRICDTCYSTLKSSIDFKEKCESSDIILKSKEEIFFTPVKCEEDTTVDTVKIEYNADIYNEDNLDCTPKLINEQDCKDQQNDKKFLCKIPKQETDKKLIPLPEFKSRAIDLKLICHDCGGSFKSKCKLKVHWKKVHMLASLVCPLCKRAFKSYKAFHIHRKKKSKSCEIATHKNVKVEGVGTARVFICEQCNYRSKRAKDISSHIVTHTGDRPYKCNICSKTYTQQSSLQGHQEGSHQMYIVQMTCHICGKFVKGRRKVQRHLSSHSTLECPVCYKTVNKLTYPQHMKRHSGTKSYACEKCASTFFTLGELCNHRRWKHNKNILKCDLCTFTSNKEQTMKNHKSKHGNKNIPCTVCGKFFLNNDKLLKHQTVHYSDKKFSCPKCDLRFFKRDSVRRHLKVKHSADIQQEITTPTIKLEANGLNPVDGTE